MPKNLKTHIRQANDLANLKLFLTFCAHTKWKIISRLRLDSILRWGNRAPKHFRQVVSGGGGSVGSVGPQFEFSHWHNLYYSHTVNCTEKTKIKKHPIIKHFSQGVLQREEINNRISPTVNQLQNVSNQVFTILSTQQLTTT